jgi:hypothetical protein
LDERTAENVAPASASVPPAVPSAEIVAQSATPVTLPREHRCRPDSLCVKARIAQMASGSIDDVHNGETGRIARKTGDEG